MSSVELLTIVFTISTQTETILRNFPFVVDGAADLIFPQLFCILTDLWFRLFFSSRFSVRMSLVLPLFVAFEIAFFLAIVWDSICIYAIHFRSRTILNGMLAASFAGTQEHTTPFTRSWGIENYFNQVMYYCVDELRRSWCTTHRIRIFNVSVVMPQWLTPLTANPFWDELFRATRWFDCVFYSVPHKNFYWVEVTISKMF